MNSTITSHLSFYLENKISPVKQDLSSHKKHFDRRYSLYKYLGLPKNFIENKNILEIGPAEGHNSAYIASCKPKSLDLLEPNKYAHNGIYENFKKLNVSNSNFKIIKKKLEQFKTKKKYDIVICEAWLGVSKKERKLMKKISGFVKQDGILVTTAASPIGFLSNIIRRFLGNLVINDTLSFEERVYILNKAFSSHLKTLKNMSCPHLDWIKDVLINPGFLTIHPTPKMIFSDISKDFNFYKSYPSFQIDWRWYKELHGKKKNLKQVFLKNYYENCHNFLNYKKVYEIKDYKYNLKLENETKTLLNLLIKYENKKNTKNKNLFIKKLENLLFFIKKINKFEIKSLTEVIKLLKSGKISTNKIKNLKKFKYLFGRELFYLSVLKEN